MLGSTLKENVTNIYIYNYICLLLVSSFVTVAAVDGHNPTLNEGAQGLLCDPSRVKW